MSIEQDAAYWEIHVDMHEGESAEPFFGVATKKDRKFFKALDESEEGTYVASSGEFLVCIASNSFSPTCPLHADSSQTNGTDLMSKIKVNKGDTIGVAVQQSDLPMIQFMLNGEQLDENSISRFRGTVYPSVLLPENDGLSLQFAFKENDFKKAPPSSRFSPIMVARGLV